MQARRGERIVGDDDRMPMRPGMESGRMPEEGRYVEESRPRMGDSPGLPTARYANADAGEDTAMESERTIRLYEEELVAHRDMREAGEVVVRTEVEEVPGRIEVEAAREEVEVEHEPVGRVVTERVAPWEEENGDLVVPVYEEQLVVVKRLYLREHLRIRRISAVEQQVFEDTLKRDRLVVEDPSGTGLIREAYADDGSMDADERIDRDGRHVKRDDSRHEKRAHERDEHAEGGFLEGLVRKALQ